MSSIAGRIGATRRNRAGRGAGGPAVARPAHPNVRQMALAREAQDTARGALVLSTAALLSGDFTRAAVMADSLEPAVGVTRVSLAAAHAL